MDFLEQEFLFRKESPYSISCPFLIIDIRMGSTNPHWLSLPITLHDLPAIMYPFV